MVVTGVVVQTRRHAVRRRDREPRTHARVQRRRDRRVRRRAPAATRRAVRHQDAPFLPVEAIEGCYCNVMGLPLWNAYRLLREAGCKAPRQPSDVPRALRGLPDAALRRERCGQCGSTLGARPRIATKRRRSTSMRTSPPSFAFGFP
jgi:hypothetical protein